jgi:hypothetical protein
MAGVKSDKQKPRPGCLTGEVALFSEETRRGVFPSRLEIEAVLSAIRGDLNILAIHPAHASAP